MMPDMTCIYKWPFENSHRPNGRRRQEIKGRPEGGTEIPRSTEQHSSCLKKLSRGFSLEGRWMFTYPEEVSSPGYNCPGEHSEQP